MSDMISRKRQVVPTLLAVAGIAAVLAVAYFEISSAMEPELVRPNMRRLAPKKDYYAGSKQSISELTSTSRGLWGLISATVMILILGSLAAGAGIGGGGLFVPFYMILLDVSLNSAVPLSKATILGGAIGNFVSISRARHPNAERPLIDYESSTLMQSGELLGVVFGVLLNRLLPPFFTVIIMVFILSKNSYKTLKKAFATRAKETKAMEKAKAKELAQAEVQALADATRGGGTSTRTSDESKGAAVEMNASSDRTNEVVKPTPLQPGPTPDANGAAEPGAVTLTIEDGAKGEVNGNGHAANGSAAKENEEVEGRRLQRMYGSFADVSQIERSTSVDEGEKAMAEASPELRKILAADSVQFPLWAWGLLFPMTIYTTVHSFVKNEFRKEFLVNSCSPVAYWLWYWSIVPVLTAVMIVTGIILKKKHVAKVAAGFKYLDEDMQWTTKQLNAFPSTAVQAGVMAGLLGIGGGMVIGPLFMAIGMQPQVGTSSCAFMILWTAASGVLNYYFSEAIGVELMLYFIGFGFISGQIGQHLVSKILKRTGRPSYVVLLLGSIIGLACTSMTIRSAIGIAQDVSNDGASVLYTFNADYFSCTDYSNTTNVTNATGW